MTGSWTAYIFGEDSRSPVLPGVAGFVLAFLLWRVVRAWWEYRVSESELPELTSHHGSV